MTKQQQLSAAADTLGVPVTWLDSLITAESNHNPKAKNPYSNAIGLIQWLNPRSRDLGYANKEDLFAKNPTYSQQIGLIVKDLKRYAPFENKKELYLSVFMPAYRKKSSSTKLPEWSYDQNQGIYTVGDYVSFVERQANKKKIIKNSPIMLGALAIVIFVALNYQKKRNTK